MRKGSDVQRDLTSERHRISSWFVLISFLRVGASGFGQKYRLKYSVPANQIQPAGISVGTSATKSEPAPEGTRIRAQDGKIKVKRGGKWVDEQAGAPQKTRARSAAGCHTHCSVE